MRRFAFYPLLAGLALAGAAQAALPNWVKLNPAGSSKLTVDLTTARQVADARASSLWPKASSGDVFPCVDVEGNPVAYVFHYRTDGAKFPDYDQAVSEMWDEQPALGDRRYHARYGHVFVSARFDRTPVLRYGDGGDEYYFSLPALRTRAQDLLGAPLLLAQVYYIWPLSYFEFSAAGQSIVIQATPPYRTFTVPEFQQYVRAGEAGAVEVLSRYGDFAAQTAACAELSRSRWNRCLSDVTVFDDTAVFVSDYGLAPFYDWSYGCSPTSGAMVVGYLDAARGLGRCILDYFQRWDMVEKDNDWQIPHAQREMALDFGTDTTIGASYPQYIGPGLQTFGAAHGYDFNVFAVTGRSYNDWAWPSDSDELSNNYPLEWSVTWQQHSLAAFGFRVTAASKDMYVHTTWPNKADWWAYTDGNPSSESNTASVHPPDPDRSIRLLFPRGDTFYNHNGSGETLWIDQPLNVLWDNGGRPGDSVQIDLSTDGGWTWSEVAQGQPDNGHYTWNVPRSLPRTDAARLRILAFADGVYSSGDATFGNFVLQNVPFPPAPEAPPNGRFDTLSPVVLVVTLPPDADSLGFALDHGTDTIFRQHTTATCCTIPTGLLRYNELYGWECQAHNSFGWGDYSLRWTFRVRFNSVEERPVEPISRDRLDVAVLSRGHVNIEFALARPGPATLTIQDIAGRVVRTLTDGYASAGSRRASWDLCSDQGRRVSEDCYFAALRLGSAQAGTRLLVRKLTVLR